MKIMSLNIEIDAVYDAYEKGWYLYHYEKDKVSKKYFSTLAIAKSAVKHNKITWVF